MSALLGEHLERADRDSDARGLAAQYDPADEPTSITGLTVGQW